MNESLAVAWTDLKNAMLYFDKVICPNLECFMEAYRDRVHYLKLLEEINPTNVPITQEPYGLMIHSNCMSNDDELEAVLPAGVILERSIQFPMFGKSLLDWIGSRSQSLEHFFSGEVPLESFRQIRRSIPYRQAPAFVPPSQVLLGEKESYGRLVLTVANIELVDARALPWEKLFSLRADKVALEKLRRVFLLPLEPNGHQNIYDLEQEVEVAVHEHQAVAGELGLSTAETALNFILKDQTEICSRFDHLHRVYLAEPPRLAKWQKSSVSERPLFVHLWRRVITWELEVDRNPVAILMWQRRSDLPI